MAMGDALAEEVNKVLLEKNITVDVVIPVSSLSCLFEQFDLTFDR